MIYFFEIIYLYSKAITLNKKPRKPAPVHVFTKEQLQILNEERALHMAGKTKSYTWSQAKAIILGKRKF